MSNKRELKAYGRYDATGRLVPGSVILRKNKPKVGDWYEIQAYECCNPTTTSTTTTTLYPISTICITTAQASSLGYPMSGTYQIIDICNGKPRYTSVDHPSVTIYWESLLGLWVMDNANLITVYDNVADPTLITETWSNTSTLAPVAVTIVEGAC